MAEVPKLDKHALQPNKLRRPYWSSVRGFDDMLLVLMETSLLKRMTPGTVAPTVYVQFLTQHERRVLTVEPSNGLVPEIPSTQSIKRSAGLMFPIPPRAQKV